MIYAFLLLSSIIDVFLLTTYYPTKNNDTNLLLPYLFILIPNFGLNLAYVIDISDLLVVILNATSYFVFMFVISLFFYEQKIIRFSMIGIYFLINLISESISASVLSIFFDNVQKSPAFQYGILLSVFFRICLFYLLKFLYKHKFVRKIKFSKFLIVLAPFLSGVLLFGYIVFTYVISLPKNSVLFSWIFISLIVFLNFCLFFIFDKMKADSKKEIEYKELQFNLEKQQNQLDEAKLSQDNLQAMRHDFKNSVLILLSYIQNDDKEEALSYISTIQKEIYDIEQKLLESYTPNRELNYLILHKEAYTKHCLIDTQINCLVPEALKIDNDLIIAVVGNLIDNAIDACKLVQVENHPKIWMKFKYYQNSLFIDIRNTIPLNFNSNSQIDGIGIKNVKKIVEKNSGIYKQFIENNNYCVQVIIWDYKGEKENEK